MEAAPDLGLLTRMAVRASASASASVSASASALFVCLFTDSGSRRSVALLGGEPTLPHRGMPRCASTPRRHTVEVCASQGPQQAGHLLNDAPKGRQT